MRLRRPGHVEFEALHDISCAIDQGETVGILGHNGSGKSTLLKCIAGILTPTSGQVRVAGRLASLLELGAGFHPDLTGRENVYINAAFYGMARKETDRRFDEIVDFAELQQFIDEPVKHYSSGMYVRLGFAVAVNLDPDVLLVDEVLAVGDEVFQAKCLSRIKQFQAEGRTIVFVTHDAATVRQVCDRAIVLDHGRLVLDGAAGRRHPHVPRAPPRHARRRPGRRPPTRRRRRDQPRRDPPRPPRRPAATCSPASRSTSSSTSRRSSRSTEPGARVEIGDRAGNCLFAVDTDALGQPLAGARRVRSSCASRSRASGCSTASSRSRSASPTASPATVIDWREAVATFEVANEGRAEGTVALDVDDRGVPGHAGRVAVRGSVRPRRRRWPRRSQLSTANERSGQLQVTQLRFASGVRTRPRRRLTRHVG